MFFVRHLPCLPWGGSHICQICQFTRLDLEPQTPFSPVRIFFLPHPSAAAPSIPLRSCPWLLANQSSKMLSRNSMVCLLILLLLLLSWLLVSSAAAKICHPTSSPLQTQHQPSRMAGILVAYMTPACQTCAVPLPLRAMPAHAHDTYLNGRRTRLTCVSPTAPCSGRCPAHPPPRPRLRQRPGHSCADPPVRHLQAHQVRRQVHRHPHPR